jgi:hypothetical protein
MVSMRVLASITVALLACSTGPRPVGVCRTAAPPDDATQLARWERLGQQRRTLADLMARSLAAESDCAELGQALTATFTPHAAELDELDTLGAQTNGRFERWADARFPLHDDGSTTNATAMRCQLFRGSVVNRWLGILTIEHGCTEVD